LKSLSLFHHINELILNGRGFWDSDRQVRALLIKQTAAKDVLEGN
jgi:hypothetical protein